MDLNLDHLDRALVLMEMAARGVTLLAAEWMGTSDMEDFLLSGLDIGKPLQRCMKLRSPGIESTISFTYEKLPTFCYGCGMFGHIYRDCARQLDNDAVDVDSGAVEVDVQELPYGLWLTESRAIGGV
ncbi:hypothetical protein Salat_0671900 [Sesamum alatum]|uniref:CCHC-type domain-containing protein n=1 Tax=Sesamum alatum TaxID=300844 RepID=A0AAE1YRV4_9LAMI|nr:hypothetical protein Salat_0671900 [Sesamum alatum]